MSCVKRLITLAVIAVSSLMLVCEERVSVVELIHKSVRLECSVPIDDPPDVQWIDYVYNLDPSPSRIFNSINNSDYIVNQDHANHYSYEVDSEMTLTINFLKLDDDPGRYSCISNYNGSIESVSYYLTVAEPPTCEGKSKLKEGDLISLTCETKYSGTRRPEVRWSRGEHVIPSDDQSSVSLVKQTVELPATHKEDNQPFTCHVSYDNILTEKCDILLEVSYVVRDIHFTPANKDPFVVGDEMRCIAKGNPPPIVACDATPSVGGKGSVAWKTMVIPASWVGSRVNINCNATNTLAGVTHVVYANTSFNVIESASMARDQKHKLDLKKIGEALDDTGVVIGAIVGAAGVLLVIIIMVALVKKHKEAQRRKIAAAKAAAAKAPQR